MDNTQWHGMPQDSFQYLRQLDVVRSLHVGAGITMLWCNEQEVSWCMCRMLSMTNFIIVPGGLLELTADDEWVPGEWVPDMVQVNDDYVAMLNRYKGAHEMRDHPPLHAPQWLIRVLPGIMDELMERRMRRE
jgi:hypothetical protein